MAGQLSTPLTEPKANDSPTKAASCQTRSNPGESRDVDSTSLELLRAHLSIRSTVSDGACFLCVQGVAFICCADSLESGEVQAQAEAVLLALLQHPLQPVQLAVYSLLEQMVMEVCGAWSRTTPRGLHEVQAY